MKILLPKNLRHQFVTNQISCKLTVPLCSTWKDVSFSVANEENFMFFFFKFLLLINSHRICMIDYSEKDWYCHFIPTKKTLIEFFDSY